MSGQTSSITGIILVGGKSRRMGTDKAFLDIGGIPMFERVLGAMKESFASLLLICSLANGFDAVVPRTSEGFEPLFALYRKSCLEPMLRLLEQGNFRVYDFYPEVAVRYVDAVELGRVASASSALLNINTPQEYAMLKEKK